MLYNLLLQAGIVAGAPANVGAVDSFFVLMYICPLRSVTDSYTLDIRYCVDNTVQMFLIQKN